MFQTTVELLLQGHTICQVSQPDAYRYLSEQSLFEKVNDYLRLINRKVKVIEDGLAFVACYCTIEEENRADIRQQLRQVRDIFRPLVNFLDLAMTALVHDCAMRAGDTIRLSELLRGIEHEPTLKQQLALLTYKGIFKTSRNDISEQLNFILKKLAEAGYVQRLETGSTIYQITAKMNYIHELIDFINDSESLELETQDNHIFDDSQSEMF